MPTLNIDLYATKVFFTNNTETVSANWEVDGQSGSGTYDIQTSRQVATIDTDVNPTVDFSATLTDVSPGGDPGGVRFKDGANRIAEAIGDASETPVTVTATVDYEAPSSLSIDSIDTSTPSVSLSWSHPRATEFELLRSTSSQAGSGQKPGVSNDYDTVFNPTSDSFVDDTVEAGNTYYYAVAAYTDGFTGFLSGEVSVTLTQPNPPGGLTLATPEARAVDAAWDSVEDADEYELFRTESSGTDAVDYTPVAVTTSTSYTDTGLEDGEQYYYRVRAINSFGTSDLSSEAGITTQLLAPEITTLDTAEKREAAVEYALEDNSTDGDILIERSIDGGVTWSEVATVTDLSATAYTDTGLLDGQEYTYRLTRRTDHAETMSETARAITIIPAPTNLTAPAIGDTSVEYVWDATHNQGQTRVEYRRAGEGDNWTTYETVGKDTEAATVDGLLTGEQYEGRVVAQTDDAETEDE